MRDLNFWNNYSLPRERVYVSPVGSKLPYYDFDSYDYGYDSFDNASYWDYDSYN